MPKSPRTAQLFLGLTFWVSLQVPNRTQFVKNLQHHGGTILNKQSPDSYNLINPETQKTAITSTYHDYKFVLDSIQQKRLLDDNDYEVRGCHPVDRIAGSTSTLQKGTRTKFTPEDDQILYNWIEPFRRNGGAYKGNQIYEQLAKVHPHHTFQSWRDRYLKYVLHREGMRVTEDVQNENGTNGEVVERPVKRRRIHRSTASENDSSSPDTAQNILVESIDDEPSHQVNRSKSPEKGLDEVREDIDRGKSLSHDIPGSHEQMDQEDNSVTYDSLFCTPDRGVQALPENRYLQTSLGGQGFGYEEANHLYRAVTAICNTSPEKLKDCWLAMTEVWNRHSIEEWQKYYEYHILPEYMRANGIVTQEELDTHIAGIEAQNVRSSSPEESSERSSDSEARNGKDESDSYRQGQTLQSADGEIAENDEDTEAWKRITSEVEKELSSGSNPKSPIVQRVEITANEGRKRVTMQMDTNSAHPPLAAPVTTPLSQKKKLFGRVFELNGSLSQAQPAFLTQSQTTSMKVDITSSIPAQSNIASTGKTNTTSSSLFLPTVHKPPQSFQIPPQSLSASQDSAHFGTTLQRQDASARTPEEPVLPERITDLEADGTVDLLDERIDSEPDLAEHPPSDTGSEYMAFETAIERSQLWETESQFDGETTDQSDDENSQIEPKINTRKATPLRQYSPTERTEHSSSDDEQAESIRVEPISHSVQHEHARIETQALFEKPTQSEPSLFDLPDPDGGWETLGIIEDPDDTIETVELPDGHPLKQRQSVSDNESLGVPDSAQNSPVFIVQDRNVVTGLSVGAEDVSVEETVRQSSFVRMKQEHRARDQSHDLPQPVPRVSESARRQSTISTTNPDISVLSTSRFGRESTLASWMAMQQEKYNELPDLVFKRLASTASQAINLNSVTTATLLLERLVDTFIAHEHRRQAEYKRRNPASGKRLKAITSLSSAQAKEMLPQDIRGVWTPADDDRLISSSHVSIMLNETKHGAGGVQERINFLKSRYNLKTEGNRPVKGASMTPGPSSS